VLCPDRVISIVCLCEFPCRLREEARASGEEGFWWPFPLPDLHGEAKGVMSPRMQKQGTRGLGGNGRQSRQGIKAPVSRRLGRLDGDRDV